MHRLNAERGGGVEERERERKEMGETGREHGKR